MPTPVEFKDFNFKLAVINILMYERELLGPKFDVWKFARDYTGRKIDVEKEGYDEIPEAREYFEKLEIPAELLTDIEEIVQDGGDDIFHEVIPFWDGEGSEFDITSAEDADLLPNLKRVTLLVYDNEELFEDFRQRGIEVVKG